MKGSIYSLTNNLNGKEYIGQTTQPVRRRWNQHVCDAKKERDNTQFHKAIRKYGRDVFTVSELVFFESQNRDFFFEMLGRFEQGMISLLDCMSPHGYNWLHGGIGNGVQPGDFAGECNPMFGKKHSPETIEKLKRRAAERSLNPNWHRRLSEAKKGKPTWASTHREIVAEQTRARKIGVPRTEEEKRKISEARTGRFTGVGNSYFGRKHSEEVRAKMRKPHLSNRGENHPMWGKHHTDETKEKIRVTKASRRAEKERRIAN